MSATDDPKRVVYVTTVLIVTGRIFGCFPTTFKGFLRVGNALLGSSQRHLKMNVRASTARLGFFFPLRITLNIFFFFFTVILLRLGEREGLIHYKAQEKSMFLNLCFHMFCI